MGKSEILFSHPKIKLAVTQEREKIDFDQFLNPYKKTEGELVLLALVWNWLISSHCSMSSLFFTPCWLWSCHCHLSKSGGESKIYWNHANIRIIFYFILIFSIKLNGFHFTFTTSVLNDVKRNECFLSARVLEGNASGTCNSRVLGLIFGRVRKFMDI